jgi:hypothetical protein
MPPARFEPAIVASEQLQTHALDCGAFGIGGEKSVGFQNKNSCEDWNYICHFRQEKFGIFSGRPTEAFGGILFRKINAFKSKNVSVFH